MTENIITEKILQDQNERYRKSYNKQLEDFINKTYFSGQLPDLKARMKYVRILSVCKSMDTNPAQAVRDQVQKALMAMWSMQMRFQMAVHNNGSEINIYVGTYDDGKDALSSAVSIFKGSVNGISFDEENVYSIIDIWGKPENSPCCCGFFVGNPVVCEYQENIRNTTPIDEIIAGTSGIKWLLCISAMPVEYNSIRDKRNKWYEQLDECGRYIDVSFGYHTVSNNRSMNINEKYTGSQLFYDFLQSNCNVYDEAMKCGQWEMGAFCFSESRRNCDVFGGMLSAQMKSGSEEIKRPFTVEYYPTAHTSFQPSLQTASKESCTIVTSRELSVLCSLPIRDTCGFQVRERVDFDVFRESKGNVSVGRILNGSHMTNSEYRIELDALNRHGLVVGLTGGGKTNTVKSLLHTFKDLKCPFMIIESAKKEYYEIYNMGITDLKIYSVGSTGDNYLYINPFEIVTINGKRVSVQSHIDAVFSAFKASFIMYTPMPYVLENAIYEIYRDYGWDVEEDVNIYGRNEFPTIEDLYYKIEPVVIKMGYDQRMQHDIIGSLKARINSIRVGSKGRTLNVARSVSMEKLLEGNSVIELDDMNDEDAKAFIISLLLMQIQECRKVQPTVQLKIRHMLLIEEAHRLLKNVSSGTGESADPRGNAVEFFCNMLAELRSKGQGFLVIDQSPSKLAPDLIKNTNLKIIHRTVAGEDRHLVGSAMNMTDAQQDYLSCLKQGFAAVYSEGDNRPKIVKIPYAKNYEKRTYGRNEIVRLVSENIVPCSNMDKVNQMHINPVCRHCRRCNSQADPAHNLNGKINADIFKKLEKTYRMMLHDAYPEITLLSGSIEGVKECMLAAWCKANDGVKASYSDYARYTEFLVGELYRKA